MGYTMRRGSSTQGAPPRFTFDPRATPSSDKAPTYVAGDTCIVVRGFDIGKTIAVAEPTLVSTTATTDQAAASSSSSVCDVAQQSAGEECARGSVDKAKVHAAASGERYYPQRGLVIYPTIRTSTPTPPSPDFVPSFPSLGDDCAIESGSEFSPNIAKLFRGNRVNKQYNGPGQESPPAEPRPEEETTAMQGQESRTASVMSVEPVHSCSRRNHYGTPRPAEGARPQTQQLPPRLIVTRPDTPESSVPKAIGILRSFPVQIPPRQVSAHSDTPRPSPHSVLRASPSIPARFKTGPIDIPMRKVETLDPRTVKIQIPRPPMTTQAGQGPKVWQSSVQTRFHSDSPNARWEGGSSSDDESKDEGNPNAYDLVITYRRFRQTKELVVTAERLERGSGLFRDDDDEDESSWPTHPSHRDEEERRREDHLLKDSRWETAFLAW